MHVLKCYAIRCVQLDAYGSMHILLGVTSEYVSSCIPTESPEAIGNHQVDSPLHLWPDVWPDVKRIWFYMTLDVLTETRCHTTT